MGLSAVLCLAWPGLAQEPPRGEEGTEEKRSTRLPEASKEPSETLRWCRQEPRHTPGDCQAPDPYAQGLGSPVSKL